MFKVILKDENNSWYSLFLYTYWFNSLNIFCLQAEVARLNTELSKSKQIVSSLKDKEESLKDMLVAEKKKKKDSASSGTSGVSKTGTLSSYDKRPAALVSMIDYFIEGSHKF